MQEIVILRGIPASGKTTWALSKVGTDKNWERVNKDDIREYLNKPWSKELERKVIEIQDKEIEIQLFRGKNVIVDDTNLNPVHEQRIRQKFSFRDGKPTQITVKEFPISRTGAIERDKARAKKVGVPVIDKMVSMAANNYPHLVLQEPVNYSFLEPAIICDIDGTLALHQNRGPFEWAKLSTDKLNHKVWEAVTLLNEVSDTALLLVSGRHEKVRDATEEWLTSQGVIYDELIMRQDGDWRKDAIIKEEIYTRRIKPSYNVLWVFDDRDQTVAMWRKLGLTCFQVADGNF